MINLNFLFDDKKTIQEKIIIKYAYNKPFQFFLKQLEVKERDGHPCYIHYRKYCSASFAMAQNQPYVYYNKDLNIARCHLWYITLHDVNIAGKIYQIFLERVPELKRSIYEGKLWRYIDYDIVFIIKDQEGKEVVPRSCQSFFRGAIKWIYTNTT